jgi:hypothetical protein
LPIFSVNTGNFFIFLVLSGNRFGNQRQVFSQILTKSQRRRTSGYFSVIYQFSVILPIRPPNCQICPYLGRIKSMFQRLGHGLRHYSHSPHSRGGPTDQKEHVTSIVPQENMVHNNNNNNRTTTPRRARLMPTTTTTTRALLLDNPFLRRSQLFKACKFALSLPLSTKKDLARHVTDHLFNIVLRWVDGCGIYVLSSKFSDQQKQMIRFMGKCPPSPCRPIGLVQEYLSHLLFQKTIDQSVYNYNTYQSPKCKTQPLHIILPS